LQHGSTKFTGKLFAHFVRGQIQTSERCGWQNVGTLLIVTLFTYNCIQKNNMNISVTQLYALLSEKLDKDIAENLTAYIEAKIDKTVVEKTANLASKEDLANTKTDMIKWFVGLFLALALMVIGLYFKK
jgi:hypothetical protein